jgi:Mn2+/Fe2+ NRAMP family transporter
MYALLFVGKYTFFEKVLLFFVTLMGIAFIISMFITIPKSGLSSASIFGGLIPNVPDVPAEIIKNLKGSNIYIHLAAFVGTTMAAPTFVVRPLLMQGHGWNRENLKEEQKDALVSVILIFVMSSAIMITSAMVLNSEGRFIQKVLEMVEPLIPVLGRFALSIFMVGLISAGMSSTFPIMMVAALLIADYKEGKLDTNSPRFRILAAIACLFGLTVPILGFQPIFAQLITQVFNVFVLPLVVAGFIYLVNHKELMGEYKAGRILNLGLFGALIFSLVIAAVGVIALSDMIKTIL